jgi:hypothetical protein
VNPQAATAGRPAPKDPATKEQPVVPASQQTRPGRR